MPSTESEKLLVIPAFRESQRLPKFLPRLCEAAAALDEGSQIAIRVVDDGSGAAEQKVVSDLCAELREKFPFLQEPLLLERNRGKGGAVYAGWDAASESSELIGFVDADGSVSAEEVVRVVKILPDLAENECAYAARLHDENAGQSVNRTLVRKWLGLLFRRLTRMLLRLPVRDTQCGFKFVPAAPYREIRDQLTEKRYCFDIDLTIHLLKKEVTFREIPISWIEIPGTRLSIPQAAKMLSSLWKLSRKARS